MEYLPDDIAYQILLRVPMKTLARFRCVCKPWQFLISDPLFQREHHLRNPLLLTIRNSCDKASGTKNITLSTYGSNKGFTLVNEFSATASLPPHLYHDSVLVKCCRGFVCIGSIHNRTILLCNPSTEEVITLPLSPTQGCTLCIGFGYASSTKKFKVVRFFTLETDYSKNCCEIFTFGTRNSGTRNNWRKARNPPPQHLLSWSTAPLIQNSIHLLQQNEDDHLDSIAAFDIESEEYRVLPPPICYYASKVNPHLAELSGSLCLVTRQIEGVNLWLLKDHRRGVWVKEYSIDLGATKSVYCSIDPLAVISHRCILLNVFTERGNTLICYDTEKKSVTKKIDENCTAICFVESLASERLENWKSYEVHGRN